MNEAAKPLEFLVAVEHAFCACASKEQAKKHVRKAHRKKMKDFEEAWSACEKKYGGDHYYLHWSGAIGTGAALKRLIKESNEK